MKRDPLPPIIAGIKALRKVSGGEVQEETSLKNFEHIKQLGLRDERSEADNVVSLDRFKRISR